MLNFQQFINLCYFLPLFMTCSMTITIKTPIAKPLPINGSRSLGATPVGMSWNTNATISGTPIVSASANVSADLVDCNISNDAANCVPMR